MAAEHISSKKVRPFLSFVLRLAIVTLAAMAAAACDGSETPTTPTPPPGTPPSSPSLTCPADRAADSPSGSPVAVSFPTPPSSGGVAPVTVNCSPASGMTFPVGSTTVTCTATAANGSSAACTFVVVVTPSAPTLRISRTRFLAFGDSLTAGEVSMAAQGGLSEGPSPWGMLVLMPQASYATQLDLLLRTRYAQQAASISVTNAGKPGEFATEAARRFPDVMANLRPEVALLLAGANDLSLGTSGVTSAVVAVETMAKEARFRNARVFIGTMTPPRPNGSRTLSPSVVQSYNARLVDVARGEGAILVDLYSALLPSVSTYIGADGLHPTEAGYRRIAEAFFDAIRQELEVR